MVLSWWWARGDRRAGPVELYAGELTAGPTDEGGWRVRAELPLAAHHVSA